MDDRSDVPGPCDLRPLLMIGQHCGWLALFGVAEELLNAIQSRPTLQGGALDVWSIKESISDAERLADLTLRAVAYVELSDAAGLGTVDEGIRAAIDQLGRDVGAAVAQVVDEWLALPNSVANQAQTEPTSVGSVEETMGFLRAQLDLAGESRIESDDIRDSDRIERYHKYSALVNRITVDLDGMETRVDAAFNALTDDHREVRAAAARAIGHALSKDLDVRASLLDEEIHARVERDLKTGRGSWMQLAAEENGVGVQALVQLVDSAKSRYDLAHRWFSLKCQRLGLANVTEADRLARMPDAVGDGLVSWDAACDLVIDGFAMISPVLGDLALEVFRRGVIDAQPRLNKRDGQFCAFTVPAVGPFIHMTFRSRPADIVVLAHEVGHAVHALIARAHTATCYVPPPFLAETAALLGELSVLDRMLVGKAELGADLRGVLSTQVESAISNVFRPIAMLDFEGRMYQAARWGKRLTSATLNENWMESQSMLIGERSRLESGFGGWWSAIPEFVARPGHFLAYPFGWLLASVLHSERVADPVAGSARILKLLEAGGSGTTDAIAAKAGIDLHSTAFWNAGFGVLNDLLDRLGA